MMINHERLKMNYKELRQINVNEFTEKKGSLTYLSWTWAMDQILLQDPMANWEFLEPKVFNETMMVYCKVTAFGKTMTMHLPVMDNRNNAVKNPDARKISDAMMRCLAKCIASFGIGLYVYAGSDLPAEEDVSEDDSANYDSDIANAETIDQLVKIFKSASTKYPKNTEFLTQVRTACGVKKSKILEGTKND